jgi:general secretion pathway protein C
MSVAQWLGDKPQQHTLRWLPVLASGGAAVVLAWSAVQLLWAFFPEDSGIVVTPAKAIANTTLQTPAVTNASLAGYHLFGQTPPGELPNAPDAPETQLKFKLVGTASGRDPKSGVAIIVDDAGKQREYQTGEIVGQATVDAIYQDRVVLLYQGRLETLKLTNGSAAKSLESNNSKPGVYLDQPGSVNIAAVGVDPNAYANPVGVGSTAAFAAVREQVMANPAAMMGMLAPVFDANGNLSGVKLNAGSNEPLLTKAGIQASDVIVSVNGTRIDSIAKGQEIANNLSTANEAVIIVRREGREITLPAVRFR